MATQAAPILERIVSARRTAVAGMKASASVREWEKRAGGAPAPRDFQRAITREGVAIIAECKRRSPSGGLLQPSYDAARLARRYVAGGAAAISVLTEPEFFGGAMTDLAAVREAVPVPILCKDFLVDPVQVLAARAAGADAVLLIVAVLDQAALHELHAAAVALGMQVLVEVHEEAEVARALAIAPAMIGINNRDLTRMQTDHGTTARLRPLIPALQPVVSESGIGGRGDIEALRRLGVNAALVGESLLRAPDLEAKLAELVGS